MTSPCGWASVDDLPADVVEEELHSAVQWCGFLSLSTDILWAATGRRWRSSSSVGTCVLRPDGPRPGESGWPFRCGCGTHGCRQVGPVPAWVSADWAVTGHEPVAVRLPRSDITAVTSVTIAGAPFQGWRLDGAWLTRTDGQAWPDCGADTVVTYTYGKLPPPSGVAACVELAVELAVSAAGERTTRECRLPKRIQQVTRQGITFEELNDMEWLDRGLVGLQSVDMWIKSANPYSRPQAATVWSPDVAKARRTA
jgi:hypothetical protein